MLCRQLGPQKELLELLLEELNGWQVGTVHVHMAHQTVGFLGPFQFSQNVDQEHFRKQYINLKMQIRGLPNPA